MSKVAGDLTAHTSLSPIWRGFALGFVNYKKGALDSPLKVIKFTSCLPMVGGSLRVLRLLPQLPNSLSHPGPSIHRSMSILHLYVQAGVLSEHMFSTCYIP
jgi:hypothetical protein